MSIFRRHKHTWELKGTRSFDTMVRATLFSDWTKAGEVTTLYYVCSECQDDTSREVDGVVNFREAKELFPKP